MHPPTVKRGGSRGGGGEALHLHIVEWRLRHTAVCPPSYPPLGHPLSLRTELSCFPLPPVALPPHVPLLLSA